MPYQISLAAKQVSFGYSMFEFNIIDDQGMFPGKRISFKINNTQVSDQQLEIIKSNILQRVNNETAEKQIVENKILEYNIAKNQFQEKLVGYLDNLIKNATNQYLNKLESVSLTQKQLEIANSIKIDWKIE